MDITNWSKWQTYRKDRGTPPWIKVYRNLLSNQEWVGLSDSEKGQLVSIWILAADRGGEVPDNSKTIQKMCMLDDAPDLPKFVSLGFLTPTCQPSGDQLVTMNDNSDAPETETETETETEYIWKPDNETLDACRQSMIMVTDEMIATFRIKILDWKDKNYNGVNLRTKFISHCKGVNLEKHQSDPTARQILANTDW